MYTSCCCCFCSAQTSHTTICLLQVSVFPQADAQGCIETWSRRYGQNISFRFAMECSERATKPAYGGSWSSAQNFTWDCLCHLWNQKPTLPFFLQVEKVCNLQWSFPNPNQTLLNLNQNGEAMLTMWQRSDVIHYVSFLRSHWQSTYSFV